MKEKINKCTIEKRKKIQVNKFLTATKKSIFNFVNKTQYFKSRNKIE